MADSLDWEKSIGFVLKREGGKVDNKMDRGGRTMCGITQNTFNDYRKSLKLPPKDVFEITDDEVKTIYKTRYWNVIDCDKLDGKYACVLFDLCVNSGSNRAKKYHSIAKGNVSKLIELRRAFYNKIVQNDASQKVFLNGWMNRIDELEKYVAAWNLIKF